MLSRDKHSSLLGAFVNYGCKRFYIIDTCGQCYKTFYGYDFSKVRAFVPGKPFQLSLMFVGKAGAYPSEAPFRFSNLE